MTQTQASDDLLAQCLALHPAEIELTLGRMERLLADLGHPERRLPPVIHIAGTNGKGSVQAMIKAGLIATGARVHAYTSPHLVRFHERITLAGAEISEERLAGLLRRVLDVNAGQEITYFEITTAAALLAFAETPADWLILEVGLGGRLDATNVIDTPALTVITPVSMDHESYLGDTLQQIAGEKAGILKRGVPAVIGPQDEEALDVIEARADRLGAPLMVQGQHWHAVNEAGRLAFQDETGLLDLPLPRLRGAHQIQNAGIALAALSHLGQPDEAFEAAVTQALWPARMQPLTLGPLTELAPEAEIWLDGGHNPSAGQALADLLATLPPRPTALICAMQRDKNIHGFLRPLSAQADRLIAIPAPTGKGHAPQQIAETAGLLGLPASTADSPQAALAVIVHEIPQPRVLICGSLYLAGAILTLGQ